MHFTRGVPVKFTTKSKFLDFVKGDTGVVERTLSRFPYSTETIYLIKLDTIRGPNSLVWATSSEVIEWNQLSIL